MSYRHIRGKKIYYEVIGSGSLLLLLHGHTASSYMFREEKYYYAQNHRVVVFDYPGNGKSERSESIDRQFWYNNAQTAKQLMADFGDERYSIIGTSGGAAVALNLGLLDRVGVQNIIIDSPVGKRLSPWMSDKILDRRDKLMSNPFYQKYWYASHGEDWERVIAMDNELIRQAGLDGLDLVIGDEGDLASNILVTASKRDELIPKIGEVVDSYQHKIKQVKVRYYKWGSHPTMITRHKAFRADVLDFLEQNRKNSNDKT